MCYEEVRRMERVKKVSAMADEVRLYIAGQTYCLTVSSFHPLALGRSSQHEDTKAERC